MLFIFISCDEVSKKQLPIHNPTYFNPKLVDKSIRNVSDNHTIKDFNLINQNGVKVSSKDYENKIYVVDQGNIVDEGNHEELISKSSFENSCIILSISNLKFTPSVKLISSRSL